MKFPSLEHFGISPRRLGALGAATAAAAGGATAVVVGGSLGQARDTVAAVVAALVLYIVLSTPRRLIDGQRVAQARESPMLSASAAACLAVTGSRPRTLILLKARDRSLASAVREGGRRVLLGTRVDRAVEAPARSLASYSASAALRGVASFRPKGIYQGDEETRGLASSSDLSRETKVPMLMTVCFFTPILLVIYAVFSHLYGASELAELASFEFIVVDLAFYMSAGERGPG